MVHLLQVASTSSCGGRWLAGIKFYCCSTVYYPPELAAVILTRGVMHCVVIGEWRQYHGVM